jgi:hypothetical protein
MTDKTISDAATDSAVDIIDATGQLPREAIQTTGPKAKPPSKSDSVQKLLGRARGASIAEISAATGWQPHSVRAFLTGLRKKGITILRESRKDGETAYRIAN